MGRGRVRVIHRNRLHAHSIGVGLNGQDIVVRHRGGRLRELGEEVVPAHMVVAARVIDLGQILIVVRIRRRSQVVKLLAAGIGQGQLLEQVQCDRRK